MKGLEVRADTGDYMSVRAEMLLDFIDREMSKQKPPPDEATVKRAAEFVERLSSLRTLSKDILLRLVANPEMVDAPASALASRSVTLAECLLAELGKVEKGEFVTEEENMMQGTLFALFRQWYYKKREGAGWEPPPEALAPEGGTPG
jgi:hypothetical protein